MLAPNVWSLIDFLHAFLSEVDFSLTQMSNIRQFLKSVIFFSLVYQKDVVSNGVPGYRFVPPENIFAPPDENPENACFCVNKECNIPKGLFNMSACTFGSPTLMSWPHFYQV